jgi:hypothetical protein
VGADVFCAAVDGRQKNKQADMMKLLAIIVEQELKKPHSTTSVYKVYSYIYIYIYIYIYTNTHTPVCVCVCVCVCYTLHVSAQLVPPSGVTKIIDFRKFSNAPKQLDCFHNTLRPMTSLFYKPAVKRRRFMV